ncbi:MAG TPA: LuxR C-terminal-related transcriptional regulator [Solirubrobacteraceae bacterium]|nr:LuxR C-terminal-related transcriptional regulator [Solirubrobacteraceae bacterium]
MARSTLDPLPATKFSLPHDQPGIIVRRRLLRALDAGAEQPLTLLSAPPGSGKTALLASWVAYRGAQDSVAWVSLDTADAERPRFWRAVLHAVSGAGGGEALRTLAAHPPARADRLVAALADALEGRDVPLVLVLDDFHEVNEAVHADIDRLLHRPPPALRVMIATRADPGLRLGRMRMQGELAEIRAPDLALTLDETAEMLDAGGVAMQAADVRRLWDHTEGWVGAIRLAALALRGHPDPRSFVVDFAGDDRAISDYLLSEVMSRMSSENRSFLLRTSVAGLLNGDLADALTGRGDGHFRLRSLARSGALLAPLDRRGEWYRYHALFRELLAAELRSEAPDEVPGLHRRAATWYADHGDEARGLLHAVEAESWDLAARLAGERWVDLLIRGDVGALEPLIERLPAEWVVEDPELALAVASALLERGDHAAATILLGHARAGAERVPAEREARFVVSVAALEIHVARLRGDLAAAIEAGRELVRAGQLDEAQVDAGLRALALAHLGIAELWAGEAAEAEHHLERARGAAAEAGREWLVLISVAHLALLAATTADYARSARLARDAIALAEVNGWDRTWPAGGAYLALTTAEFLWDHGEDALHTLELARLALTTTQERPLRAGFALLRANGLAIRGEPESAVAVLQTGAEELGDWPLLPAMRDQFVAREAVLRAELGEREQAAQLVGGGRSLPTAVVLAQLQLEDGEADAAREVMAAWSSDLEHNRTPASVQAWVVDALALDVLAEHDGAAESLERALELAEPNGLRSALLDFGRALQPLLTRQLRRGTAHRALVGELLAALDGTSGRTRPQSPFVIEPLSPRERAVLRYLPTMMSNQEIASELFVSVNTVKTHLKAIYRKLDVADRREAVRRARSLELLAP